VVLSVVCVGIETDPFQRCEGPIHWEGDSPQSHDQQHF